MPKRATATVNMPVRVRWKCPECGADNDREHRIRFTGMSQGSFAGGEKLKARAREDLDREVKKQAERFEKGHFSGAGLKEMSCASCGNKPVWTQYRGMPGWAAFALFGGLAAAFACFVLLDIPQLNYILLGAAILPILAAAAVMRIRNAKVDRLTAALPEENRPRIVLPRMTGDEANAVQEKKR